VNGLGLQTVQTSCFGIFLGRRRHERGGKSQARYKSKQQTAGEKNGCPTHGRGEIGGQGSIGGQAGTVRMSSKYRGVGGCFKQL